MNFLLLKAPKRVLSVSVAVLLPARVKPPVKARRVRRPVPVTADGPALKVVRCPFSAACPKEVSTIFATEYAIVNVSDLNDRFEDGATVNAESLVASGLLKKTLDGVKVLGKGEITKALTVQVTAISESAKSKIEAAGGKVEVL